MNLSGWGGCRCRVARTAGFIPPSTLAAPQSTLRVCSSTRFCVRTFVTIWRMRMDLRVCLSIPVPAIRAATALLSDAADAHAEGRRSEASELIRAADCDDIRAWTSTIMGRINGQIHGPGPLPSVAKIPAASLDPVRMPRREQKKELIERDGWNCRFWVASHLVV